MTDQIELNETQEALYLQNGVLVSIAHAQVFTETLVADILDLEEVTVDLVLDTLATLGLGFSPDIAGLASMTWQSDVARKMGMWPSEAEDKLDEIRERIQR